MPDFPERQFDTQTERRYIAEMEAALEDHPVLLVSEWASVAMRTGRTGQAGDELDPMVMVRIQGRINKTQTTLDFGMLVTPGLAETIRQAMSAALDRLATNRDGFHDPVG